MSVRRGVTCDATVSNKAEGRCGESQQTEQGLVHTRKAGQTFVAKGHTDKGMKMAVAPVSNQTQPSSDQRNTN